MSSQGPFLLTDFETNVWLRIEARLHADLAKARADLENAALDDKPLSSARLRSRISVLKEYLALPSDARAAYDKAQKPPQFHHDGD